MMIAIVSEVNCASTMTSVTFMDCQMVPRSSPIRIKLAKSFHLSVSSWLYSISPNIAVIEKAMVNPLKTRKASKGMLTMIQHTTFCLVKNLFLGSRVRPDPGVLFLRNRGCFGQFHVRTSR